MTIIPTALTDACRRVLEAAWRSDPGYCVPNGDVYPHQWLWDSCFHSVVWATLGDKRSLIEVDSALANMSRSGFVPHMTYWSDPHVAADYWGRSHTSCITQPPMYGHALRFAAERGLVIDDELLHRARRGLEHLLTERPRVDGLIAVLHPWETGCDNSARWDDWCPGGHDRERWRETKTDMVAAVEFSGDAPVGSKMFRAGSVGFNALVVWNARELAAAGADVDTDELQTAVANRWDPELRTWTDPGSESGGIRTLDALLPVLIDPRNEVFDDLIDPAAYGATFGPCGVHRDEASFDPDTYWRGPAWPQLTYLLAVAARRAGRNDVADALMDSLRRAATANDFAEYWNPDTGEGRGAAPQTWTALACVRV